MPELRQESQFLRDSIAAGETIDLSTYDRAGRFGTGGVAILAGADETPQFLFMESGATGEPVSIAYIGMGQAALAMSGSGSKGDKVSIAANGVFEASATTQGAQMDEDDVGVALEDWTDAVEIEVFIYRGGKL